jgi:hypothetical protein
MKKGVEVWLSKRWHMNAAERATGKYFPQRLMWIYQLISTQIGRNRRCSLLKPAYTRRGHI